MKIQNMSMTNKEYTVICDAPKEISWEQYCQESITEYNELLSTSGDDENMFHNCHFPFLLFCVFGRLAQKDTNSVINTERMRQMPTELHSVGAIRRLVQGAFPTCRASRQTRE